MSKHYSAPWEMTFSKTGGWAHLSASDAHGIPHYRFAKVVWRMDDDEHSPACQANARLIAAAPDLLNALIALTADTQHEKHECGDSFCPVAIARAAIAKATGETP